MQSENDEASAKTSPLTGELETETRSGHRTRMPHLLQRPFDVRSFALTGLFILAIFYTMYFMRSILLPIVLAILFSYLCKPVLRAMGKVGVRPALGAGILVIGLLAIVGYGISFLAVPAAGWLEKSPYGFQQLQKKLLPLRRPMEQVAKASGEIDKLTTPEDVTAPKPAVTVAVKPAGSVSDGWYARMPEYAVSTILFLILLYFLLAYDEVFLSKVIKMLPRLEDKKRAVTIAHEIESHISRYLLTITLINIGLGVAVGATVGFLGLSNPILWGVLVAVLNFVPYVGALIGIICMMVGAVLSYDSLSYALVFPASYLFIATIEGNLITPWVMGRSLTLNPVIILISITFWGWMWGIAGVILAVPILAALKIFSTHIKEMEPIAEFLS